MAVVSNISMSLDGFIAGPNPSVEHPLGEGGERLHEWAYGLAAFRERHGRSGGEVNADNEVLTEAMDRSGATVMGRNMFGGGEGPWGDDPWEGWWGDDPPFHTPVFVLTHHRRDPLEKRGGTAFTFVPEGIETAIERAAEAAGGKDVSIAGGADAIRQSLHAGLLTELQIHLVPVLLGGGTRLLDGLDPAVALRRTRVVDSPEVTHLSYAVER